jgi:hypothetical protein
MSATATSTVDIRAKRDSRFRSEIPMVLGNDRSTPTPASMMQQRDEDDDRNWHAQQKQKNGPTHDFLLLL